MKTPEYFYKQVAEELGIDISIVKAVNKYYWEKGVKAEIRNPQNLGIYINEIGTLFIRWNPTIRLIKQHISILRGLKKKERTTDVQNRIEYAEQELRKLWIIKQKLSKNRDKVYNDRRNRYSKINSQSTSECSTDSGGNSEQYETEARESSSGPATGDN